LVAYGSHFAAQEQLLAMHCTSSGGHIDLVRQVFRLLTVAEPCQYSEEGAVIIGRLIPVDKPPAGIPLVRF
jgi:hypothetical protein